MQSDTLSEGDDELRVLVSAILSGERAEETYLEDISSICQRKPQSAAALRAIIGRYHRLGDMPAAQHQRIQATIEEAEAPQPGRRAASARGDGATYEDLTCDLSSEPVIGSQTRVFTHQSPAPQITVRPAPAPRASATAPPPLAPKWSPAPADSGPSSAATADDAHAGHRVLHDRYELQQVLGRGGMALVYKAVDRNRTQLGLPDCFVALKLVQANAAKLTSAEALAREFHSAQRLSHPNVVKVFDIDHDGDTIFYTMEMLSGQRLSQVLQRLDGAALPRQIALAIIRDMGAAVTHAHGRGVVHADLKPSNVMITLDGEVRVLDFGGASMPPREPWVSEGDAEEAYLAATPAYASCEQLERRRADPRDDIYALACIAYLLLSGRHPFEQLSSIEARARGLRARRPANASFAQWRVLRRGLAWSRDQQPQSVQQWLAQLNLKGAAGALPPLVALTTQAPPRPAWGRGAAIALALLAAGAIFWSLQRPHSDWGRNLGAAVGTARDSLRDAWHTAAPGGHSSAAPGRSSQPMNLVTAVPPALAAPPPATAAPPPATAAPPATSTGNALGAPSVVSPRVARADTDINVAPHVTFAAQNYTVANGEPAARIVVQRVGNLDTELNFMWWTEPESAQPDVDYASMGRRIEHMASGQDKLTFYVPIISSPVRSPSTQFQVLISELGGDPGNAQSARATVTIERGG